MLQSVQLVVETLYLLEDEAIKSMGLAGVTYSAGGGVDETTTVGTDIGHFGVTSASFGTIFHANGTTAVTLNEVLTLAELRGLKFKTGTNASGSENFIFTVTDGGTSNGGTDKLTLTETLAINITPFNDTPVVPSPSGANAIIFEQANGSERTATEDTSFEFDLNDLLNGVTDPDIDLTATTTNPYGDVLAVSPTSVTATNGSITYNGTTSKWTFTPNNHFNGNSRIDYLIDDGQGGTIPNSITLKVDSVNDAPVATFTTQQNTKRAIHRYLVS